MRCAIWYNLYNLNNVKNTHGGVVLLVKFTKAKLRNVHLYLATLFALIQVEGSVLAEYSVTGKFIILVLIQFMWRISFSVFTKQKILALSLLKGYENDAKGLVLCL